MTTVPPLNRVEKAIQCAVPWVNGDAGRQRVRPAVATALATSSSGDPTGSPPGLPPPRAANNTSSWRHTTPLGSPVVPPVYSR